MVTKLYCAMDNNELYHYGVLGMRWGVRKSAKKIRANARLAKRANEYDLKSERLTRKSERMHERYDFGSANKAQRKASRYRIKAIKYDKKALRSDDLIKKLKYEKKSAKLNYKADAAQVDANRLSKSVGYGLRAMKYSVKSDIVRKKAAKVRLKMAKNELYVAATKRKMNTLQDDPNMQRVKALMEEKLAAVETKYLYQQQD